MRHQLLAFTVVLGCNQTQPPLDAVDAASDAACNGNPVNSGGILATPCSQENATGCGIAAQCTDYGFRREVTCTCRKGIWDCEKCPDCNAEVLRWPTGANVCGASLCRVCQGGMVTRCDGITVPVTGCYCGCGMGDVCIELEGGAYLKSCHADAGPDVVDAAFE